MATVNPWLPYCGAGPAPAELLFRWNLDPPLLIVIAIIGLSLWRHSPRPGVVPAAAVMAVLLFISPLCALTSALFAARSLHHVLLVGGLAPLLALAVPPRWLPAAAAGLFWWTASAALALWLWHLPSVYAASLSDPWLYWALQLLLLGTATGFWMAAAAAGPGPAILAMLANMVQTGLLGALLTFAGVAVYAPHALTTAAWGLGQLADQQLGGLIMWVPGGGVYLGAALVALRRLMAAGPMAAVA